MQKFFNVRHEVEAVLGRDMTEEEGDAFRIMRECGYANPYDIVAALPRYMAEIEEHAAEWAADVEREMMASTRGFHTNF